MKLNQPDNRRLGGKSGCRQFPNAVSETCKRIITNSELLSLQSSLIFQYLKSSIFEPKDVQNLNLTACEKGSTEKKACYQNEAQTV